MREVYSIVIRPPDNDITLVKDMKMLMTSNVVDRYRSQNSEAHITMVNFKADLSELNKVISYLESFCLSTNVKDLSFIKVDSFPKTIYLGASTDTQEWFKILVKRFSKHFPLNKKASEFKMTTTPHITIGRELKALDLIKACHLFENHKVDIAFLCESITVRKLNRSIGQYEVLSSYIFGNKPDLDIENQQLSLFD